MQLKFTDESCVFVILRREAKGHCYEIQGIAIADERAEAERKARAICRNHSYFWIGPIPANAALPHTTFRLQKHYLGKVRAEIAPLFEVARVDVNNLFEGQSDAAVRTNQ